MNAADLQMYDLPNSGSRQRPGPAVSAREFINRNRPAKVAEAEPPTPESSSVAMPAISLESLSSWAWRGRLWILVFAILGAVAAIAFVSVTKQRYTAFTDIIVPPSNPQVVPDELAPQNQQSDSQLMDIESKLLLLKSGNVLQRVVTTLKLGDVPEFNGKESTMSFDWRALLGEPSPKGDPTATAVRELFKRIKVERQPRSYMATIGVWARDPELAVRISDSLPKAFNGEVSQTQSDIAGSATSALAGRLEELKQAAKESESKVAAFRQQHNLQTSSGQLVSAQSMSGINLKLIDAKSTFLKAKSKYQQLTSERSNAASPLSSLQSATLTDLRSQYATLKQRLDKLSLTYGPRYPELIAAKQQIQSLESEISLETDRILQAARNDMDQANLVMQDLTKQLETSRGVVSTDDDAKVALAELERDFKAKSLLYETFLKRAGETGEQEQLKVTNIRVVSAPVLPERRSWPPPLMLMAPAGAAGGTALGIALAIAWGFGSAFLGFRKSIRR